MSTALQPEAVLLEPLDQQAIDACIRLLPSQVREASEKLSRAGEAALVRLLDVAQGKLFIDWGEQASPMDAMDNLTNALSLSVRRNIDAFARQAESRVLFDSSTVVWAIGNVAHPCVVALLLKALKSRQVRARWSAAHGLAYHPEPRVVAALNEALADRSENVRHAALQSLQAVGDGTSIPALERFQARPKANEYFAEIARGLILRLSASAKPDGG